MTEKKPWYLHTLARMDTRARELCSGEALRELGGRILASELSGHERDAIDAELERMLADNGAQYDQVGASFLKHFRQQVKQWPWYVTLLEQMVEYARTPGFTRHLREAGGDLLLSHMDPPERESIVMELDRMLSEDLHAFRPSAVEYLTGLRAEVSAQA